MEMFYQLLEHKFMREALDIDPCLKLTDKYLLATVQVYFQRARLKEEEYIVGYFFGAVRWQTNQPTGPGEGSDRNTTAWP
ncbi:hypothetical protein XELAEV_18000501mg [Xenopus laevis]|uniref:Uncharacterized protein n=1 Tax=Xenopus laevis TaxID=8355 RepID=A0A974BQ77_XENLA|nr:hypothetical protein XELAEV_18000501mg [Xenopus laevis]